MDYLTRAEQEHEALRVMLAVKKELLTRLAKARGVNLAHLENTLQFWREFFGRQHLPAEEEFFFTLLRRLHHPVLEELAEEHEELYRNLDELSQISRRLREGKPNSGREFVEAGERFTAFLERHLNKENSIFAELTVKGAHEEITGVMPPPEDTAGLSSLLENLSREYLGRECKLSGPGRRETVKITEERLESRAREEDAGGEEPTGVSGSYQNGREAEEEAGDLDGESRDQKEQVSLPEQAGIGEEKEN